MVHVIGASILFVLGNIYAWFQVVISFHMKQLGFVRLCICITRFMLSVISTVSLIVCTMMWSSAGKKWSGNNLKWDSSDPGYKEHVVGDAFEWLIVLSFLCMFLTFTKEFCKSKLVVNFVRSTGSDEPILI